jgi:hypothetical protein
VAPEDRQGPSSSKQLDSTPSDSTPSEFATVQRWRKTESTARDVRPSRVITQPIASAVAIEPQPSDTRSETEPLRFTAPPSSSRQSVVPVKWDPQDEPTQGPDLSLPPVRLKAPPVDKQKLILQDAQPQASQPPAIPNPFPPANSRSESPSDQKRSPLLGDDSLDLPPLPPQELQRAPINCDQVREFIGNLDIRRIRVDSSPMFAEGYPSKDRTNTNTKENFVAEAPVRSWYSQSGEEIARGKLVDLVFDSVVLEKQDGTKGTYLLRKLSDPDQAYVSEAWGIPVTCSLGDQDVSERMFADSILTWKASGLCHNPLYFEDVKLERYGHEWGPVVQPALSTVRFFGDLAVLPYKMGIHPPQECQYPLGYYRPGECAPWTHGPVPISLRGALSQAAFVTGTAWALP